MQLTSSPVVCTASHGHVAVNVTEVAEILKDRPRWFLDCRHMEVLGALPIGNGGTIELLYTVPGT